MTFLSFNTQDERRQFGGSAFIEIQFCKMKETSRLKQVVAVSSINHWQSDSLYIYDDDMSQFYAEYSSIFDCGIYNNLKSGKVDLFGINYYQANSIDPIIAKIQKAKPSGCETLLAWLNQAKHYNGLYILGF